MSQHLIRMNMGEAMIVRLTAFSLVPSTGIPETPDAARIATNKTLGENMLKELELALVESY